MSRMSSTIAVSLALWAVVWLGQWFCAWSWGPLADEALYWDWGRHLAWGYLDQPPAIAAWAHLLSGSGAPHIGQLRLSSLGCGLVILLATAAATERRAAAGLANPKRDCQSLQIYVKAAKEPFFVMGPSETTDSKVTTPLFN